MKFQAPGTSTEDRNNLTDILQDLEGARLDHVDGYLTRLQAVFCVLDTSELLELIEGIKEIKKRTLGQGEADAVPAIVGKLFDHIDNLDTSLKSAHEEEARKRAEKKIDALATLIAGILKTHEASEHPDIQALLKHIKRKLQEERYGKLGYGKLGFRELVRKKNDPAGPADDPTGLEGAKEDTLDFLDEFMLGEESEALVEGTTFDFKKELETYRDIYRAAALDVTNFFFQSTKATLSGTAAAPAAAAAAGSAAVSATQKTSIFENATTSYEAYYDSFVPKKLLEGPVFLVKVAEQVAAKAKAAGKTTDKRYLEYVSQIAREEIQREIEEERKIPQRVLRTWEEVNILAEAFRSTVPVMPQPLVTVVRKITACLSEQERGRSIFTAVSGSMTSIPFSKKTAYEAILENGKVTAREIIDNVLNPHITDLKKILEVRGQGAQEELAPEIRKLQEFRDTLDLAYDETPESYQKAHMSFLKGILGHVNLILDAIGKLLDYLASDIAKGEKEKTKLADFHALIIALIPVILKFATEILTHLSPESVHDYNKIRKALTAVFGNIDIPDRPGLEKTGGQILLLDRCPLTEKEEKAPKRARGAAASGEDGEVVMAFSSQAASAEPRFALLVAHETLNFEATALGQIELWRFQIPVKDASNRATYTENYREALELMNTITTAVQAIQQALQAAITARDALIFSQEAKISSILEERAAVASKRTLFSEEERIYGENIGFANKAIEGAQMKYQTEYLKDAHQTARKKIQQDIEKLKGMMDTLKSSGKLRAADRIPRAKPVEQSLWVQWGLFAPPAMSTGAPVGTGAFTTQLSGEAAAERFMAQAAELSVRASNLGKKPIVNPATHVWTMAPKKPYK